MEVIKVTSDDGFPRQWDYEINLYPPKYTDTKSTLIKNSLQEPQSGAKTGIPSALIGCNKACGRQPVMLLKNGSAGLKTSD